MTVVVPAVCRELLILLLLSSMSGDTGRDDDEKKRRWLIIVGGWGNNEREGMFFLTSCGRGAGHRRAEFAMDCTAVMTDGR